MLEIPIGTVMSRLHRGRKAMQKALFDFAEQRGLTAPPEPTPSDEKPDTVVETQTEATHG